MSPFRRSAAAFLLGCVALAVLTLLCLKLQLSAPVLYLLVVVFVALDGSFAAAACVSIVAALALQSFFAAPLLSLHGADSRNAMRFVLWLVTAFVISRLVLRARRREQNLQLVMEAMPALVAVGSSVESGAAAGDVYCNQRFLDYTGRSPEDLHGERFHSVLHPDDQRWYAAEWKKAVAGGQPVTREVRLRDRAGNYRLFLHHLFPLRDASGETQWCTTSIDIDDRKRAEETLRHAQEDLARVNRATTMGELVASIAHEVNQPLAAIVTNANASLRWLAAAPPNLDEVREATERIIADGNRASDVVGRIRAMLAKKETRKEALQVGDVIADVVALTKSAAQRNETSVEIELSAAPVVLADRVQLQQVLLNLILNGMDAMNGLTGRPRTLTIQSRPHEEQGVFVAVRDSGAGIAAEHLPHIFDAFYTTKSGGLGMGLAIGRSIIEAHGGRIWATSEPSRGSTFQFTLPAAESDT
ncbi:MAG TPA: ATP-binding protein [Thermoanaerobaculia bacterium]|nr:ATP-binding protein [Thermoanaerobaculia bacterium]